MSTIRGSKQRNIESTTEQPDVTTNATSASGLASDVPDAVAEPGREHLTGIGYLLLAAFFLLLAFGILVLVWNAWRRRRNHHRTTDGNENPTIDIETTAASKQRMQRRYETIEHWIITKRVLPHTERCKMIEEMLLTNSPQQTVIRDESEARMSNSMVCEDRSTTNSTPECPICMSEIKMGQIVSWSSNAQCIHVYHHECIKEWLLRHTQCCMCKQTYLSVDTKQGRDKKSLAVAELSQQYASAAATSFYCVQNGLIRIPESIRCTRTQLQQMEQHLLSVTVTPSELINLRGKNGDRCRQSEGGDNDRIYNLPHQIFMGSASTDELTAPMELTASFESDMEGIETAAINITRGDMEKATVMSVRTYEDLTRKESLPSPWEHEQWVHWDQELVSVADYLEQSQMLPDNRCCIKETNEIDGGIEVEVTTGRSCHEENDGSEGSG